MPIDEGVRAEVAGVYNRLAKIETQLEILQLQVNAIDTRLESIIAIGKPPWKRKRKGKAGDRDDNTN